MQHDVPSENTALIKEQDKSPEKDIMDADEALSMEEELILNTETEVQSAKLDTFREKNKKKSVKKKKVAPKMKPNKTSSLTYPMKTLP